MHSNKLVSMRKRIYQLYLSTVKQIVLFTFKITAVKKLQYLIVDFAKSLESTSRIKLENGKEIHFLNASIDAVIRSENFFIKEPETLKWISSFSKEDIFWDIGANMGVYSLYAAKNGINTFAFEPSFASYWLLNRNISLNKLNNVSAYCIAFSDKTHATKFSMGDIEAAGACNQLGDYSGEMHYVSLGKIDVVFAQGAISFSIDDAISIMGFSQPNHIKIDVDGFENYIIEGALKTLSNPNFKSVLIEINEELSEHLQIIKILQGLGFNFNSYKSFDESVPYIKNYIFTKS